MKKFFLDLGYQPLANNYLSKFKKKQTKYKLKIYFDSKSKLVSISKKIPSKKMFNSKYPYRSSMSKTMKTSFNELSKKIKKKFKPKMLLEIGSNDGVLLKNFKKKTAIGIEPCSNLAEITNKLGYKTYDKYWNYNTASFLKEKYNKFDVIFSANTITHIPNLNEVFKSLEHLLAPNGVIIIEDPSLLDCLKINSYDQFYNEHIYVFSAIALKNILKKYNLELFDVENLKTHGGSLRYFIKRKKNINIKINSSVNAQLKKEYKFGIDRFKTYKKFSKNVSISKNKLVKLLKTIKNKKNKIIGYGATAKATTVLNYCNIDNKIIDYFVDTTPDKINKFMPNKNIKIYKYSQNNIQHANYIFLGAWNFQKEILKKEKRFIQKGGKFITHIPFAKIIIN